jgi:hypothetical protein
VRQAAADYGLRVPVMAKIERPEAVQRSAAIIQAFDGIMVARGDLGVETAFEELPTVQKQLIAAARLARRPQMIPAGRRFRGSAPFGILIDAMFAKTVWRFESATSTVWLTSIGTPV